MIEKDFQLHLVLSAIARGYQSIGEIARECGGFYPLELQRVLDELVKEGKIVPSTEGYHLVPSTNVNTDLAKTNSQKRSRYSIELPEPHPHDYDWRFDNQTSSLLAKMLVAESLPQGRVLLLGAPSIFVEMSKFQRVPHTTLLDWSAELINYLNQYRFLHSFVALNHNLSSSTLWQPNNPIDVVLCDPPWYLEYYAAFLAQAAYVTKIGGVIAASLFPMSTRPGAVKERWKVLEFANKLGLHVQSIEAGKLRYKTPLFELASLRSTGIEIGDNWRRGDLILFRKVDHPRHEIISEIYVSTQAETQKEEWAEFLFGRYKIKLRGPFNDYSEVPELISIEKDNVLPTVSRRYKGRVLIDLWLWDNRVFAIKGRASLWTALHALAGKPLPIDGNQIVESNRKRALGLLQRVIGNIGVNFCIQKESISKTIDLTISPLSLLQGELYKNENSLNVEVLAQICSQINIRGHLAILTQPYLDKILAGKKTIESRFSKVRVPPFYKVNKGDILVLKEAAGSIVGIASVSNVKFFGPLKPQEVELVMQEYGDGLALEKPFTIAKQDSKYASLIYIGQVLPTKPLAIAKTDRRAWIVLNDGRQNSLF